MGFLESGFGRVYQFARRKRFALTKAVVLTPMLALIGLTVFKHRSTSIWAAEAAGGIASVVAVAAAYAVLHSRLNIFFHSWKRRRAHVAHFSWMALVTSEISARFSGGWKNPGDRTESLVYAYIVSKSLPGQHGTLFDEIIKVPKEQEQDISRYREATEKIIQRVELEGPRSIYLLNLISAYGLLVQAVGYELGGHGYLSDTWQRDLQDWSICATAFHQSLAHPLGPPPSDTQLLYLLNRLRATDYTSTIYRSFEVEDIVRLRKLDCNEWTQGYPLVQIPNIAERMENGMPIWKLVVRDENNLQVEYLRGGLGFEPNLGGDPREESTGAILG